MPLKSLIKCTKVHFYYQNILKLYNVQYLVLYMYNSCKYKIKDQHVHQGSD